MSEKLCRDCGRPITDTRPCPGSSSTAANHRPWTVGVDRRSGSDRRAPQSEDVEGLVGNMREWAGNCSGYSAAHMKDRADEAAQYYRGASEAFTRCAEALARLRSRLPAPPEAPASETS